MIFVKGLQIYQRSKLEVEKKSTGSAPGASVSNLAESAIFFRPLTLTSDIFVAHDQKKCLVPHLKDLLHIYLEPGAQGDGMLFKSIYIISKYPQIIS